MKFSEYSSSQSFFEIYSDSSSHLLDPVRGRVACLKDFFKKLLVLPFALFFKVYKTFFRSIGLLLSAVIIVATLGTSAGGRDFFRERVSSLAKDLADWVLLPVAILACLVRLLLAFVFSPKLYFRH